jgi:hypothetical protein
MGWTVYVKDNDEGQDLLKIITQEPPHTFTNVVESFEKAGAFTKQSYMKKGKKIVKGNQKMLRILMQEAKPSKQTRRQQPPPIQQNSYENIMHDIIYSGDQDDDDVEQNVKVRQKEELDKKAVQLEETRGKTRPPPKVPKDEKMEDLYATDDLRAEDDMNDYLMSLVKGSGED